jgi:hypothetical protein
MIPLRNLTIAAALGLATVLVAPVASAPALAATPGSACTIEVAIFGDDNEGLVVPGTVSASGNSCVPTTPLSGALSVLNAGLACGTEIETAFISAEAICPN